MTNHRTKREIAANRAAFIAGKATVIQRYLGDGASLAALCRDYGVGIVWVRWQFDEWAVPLRARRRTRDAVARERHGHEAERSVLAARLADPGLLEQSVVVDLTTANPDGARPTRLAVPIGGVRVAGELRVANWGEALLVILQLARQPGQFPRVRQRVPLRSPEKPRAVCWGEPTPRDNLRVQGRMFGYHDTGIDAYSTNPLALEDGCAH
ncbi:DUF6302 family protein [Streptomyces sp. NPDC002688]|uniref:DUF6302 family protein n=1 Tax=Streptomyces sp. NPDC002688 TaxID=3154423 RepID=UPI00332689EB